MGGIKIIDGSLVLSVTDEKQVKALAKLDLNHDGKVEVEDVFHSPMSWITSSFREKVTLALADGGAFKSELQQKSFRKFLDIHPKIQQFNKVTSEWAENNTNTTVRELEFEKAYFDRYVYSQISAGGDLTSNKISKLSVDLYTTMYGLADSKVPKSSDYYLPTVVMDCGTTYISYLIYSTANVPSFVREQLVDDIKVYSNSAAWLGQYREIECDGGNAVEEFFRRIMFGHGRCVIEQVSFEDTTFIPPLRTCASEDGDGDNLHCASMSIFEHDTPAAAYTSSTERCEEIGPITPIGP